MYCNRTSPRPRPSLLRPHHQAGQDVRVSIQRERDDDPNPQKPSPLRMSHSPLEARQDVPLPVVAGESCIPGGALQGLGHPPPGAPSRVGLHHYWVVPTLPNATKKHLHRTSYSLGGSSFTLEYRPVSCNLRVPSLQTTDR